MADPLSDVTIVPVPTNCGVGVARDNDTNKLYVILRISTPLGASHYFLDAKTASKLAGALGQSARQAVAQDPGIIIPNGDGS